MTKIFLLLLVVSFCYAQEWNKIDSMDFLRGRAKWEEKKFANGQIDVNRDAVTLKNSAIFFRNFEAEQYTVQFDFLVVSDKQDIAMGGLGHVSLYFPFRDKLLEWKIIRPSFKVGEDGFISGINQESYMAYKLDARSGWISICLKVTKNSIAIFWKQKDSSFEDSFIHNDNHRYESQNQDEYPLPCLALRCSGTGTVRNIVIRFLKEEKNQIPDGKKIKHIVLMGDSIFDNKRYIPMDAPDVIQQVKKELANDGKASLLAVDGNIVEDISNQIRSLPSDATNIILSIGGNNALQKRYILNKQCSSSQEIFMELSQIRENFEKKYRTMLEEVMAKRIKIAVCTIYNPNFENPQYQKMAVTALDIFNGCIIKVASEKGLPILDLRQVFTENKDYANPIEPSQLGGQKIAKLIKKVVSGHDWEKNVTVIYKD